METFGQFVTSLEEKFVALGGEGDESPFSRMGPAVEVQGVEDPLLAALLSWHNGGVPLGDHITLSVEEFSALGANEQGLLPIAKDMDDDPSLWIDGAGVVHTSDGSLNQTLGGFCALFLFKLQTNAYEWAGGWVERA